MVLPSFLCKYYRVPLERPQKGKECQGFQHPKLKFSMAPGHLKTGLPSGSVGSVFRASLLEIIRPLVALSVVRSGQPDGCIRKQNSVRVVISPVESVDV